MKFLYMSILHILLIKGVVFKEGESRPGVNSWANGSFPETFQLPEAKKP